MDPSCRLYEVWCNSITCKTMHIPVMMEIVLTQQLQRNNAWLCEIKKNVLGRALFKSDTRSKCLWLRGQIMDCDYSESQGAGREV